MSSNGSRPTRPRRGLHVRRRVALIVGAVAALLITGVLVAPIVIVGSAPKATACAQTLAYQGVGYDARRVSGAVQQLAVGVGTASGCNEPTSQVNVRSVSGLPTSRAVAVETDATSIYVRHGLCQKTPADRLLACLRGQ